MADSIFSAGDKPGAGVADSQELLLGLILLEARHQDVWNHILGMMCVKTRRSLRASCTFMRTIVNYFRRVEFNARNITARELSDIFPYANQLSLKLTCHPSKASDTQDLVSLLYTFSPVFLSHVRVADIQLRSYEINPGCPVLHLLTLLSPQLSKLEVRLTDARHSFTFHEQGQRCGLKHLDQLCNLTTMVNATGHQDLPLPLPDVFSQLRSANLEAPGWGRKASLTWLPYSNLTDLQICDYSAGTLEATLRTQPLTTLITLKIVDEQSFAASHTVTNIVKALPSLQVLEIDKNASWHTPPTITSLTSLSTLCGGALWGAIHIASLPNLKNLSCSSIKLPDSPCWSDQDFSSLTRLEFHMLANDEAPLANALLTTPPPALTSSLQSLTIRDASTVNSKLSPFRRSDLALVARGAASLSSLSALTQLSICLPDLSTLPISTPSFLRFLPSLTLLRALHVNIYDPQLSAWLAHLTNLTEAALPLLPPHHQYLLASDTLDDDMLMDEGTGVVCPPTPHLPALAHLTLLTPNKLPTANYTPIPDEQGTSLTFAHPIIPLSAPKLTSLACAEFICGDSLVSLLLECPSLDLYSPPPTVHPASIHPYGPQPPAPPAITPSCCTPLPTSVVEISTPGCLLQLAHLQPQALNSLSLSISSLVATDLPAAAAAAGSYLTSMQLHHSRGMPMSALCDLAEAAPSLLSLSLPAVDDDTLIHMMARCKALETLSLQTARDLTGRAFASLPWIGKALKALVIKDMPQVSENDICALVRMPALESLVLKNARQLKAQGVARLLAIPRLVRLQVQGSKALSVRDVVSSQHGLGDEAADRMCAYLSEWVEVTDGLF